MKTITVEYAHCGKSFERPAKRVKQAEKYGWRQFCCKLCQSASKTKSRRDVCTNCGVEISILPVQDRRSLSGNFFCCSSCAGKFNSKNRAVSASQKRKVADSLSKYYEKIGVRIH